MLKRVIDSIFKTSIVESSHQISAVEQENLTPNVQDGEMKFLDASTILQIGQLDYYVKEIKEVAGLSDEAFELYYLPVINNFVRFCQSVPASERYHHAYPYGLVEHSLEVALYAIRRSQGCVYYPDGNVETLQWFERVFMYAVFCAGLLHDGGKAIGNQHWSILDKGGKWVRWSHLINAMPTEKDNVYYRIKPFSNKKGVHVFHQRSHEILASYMLDLIPIEGVDWILQFSDDYCAELFIHFIHALGGDYENSSDIGLCVKHADQVSTADAVIRYHKKNKSSDFVDFSDPNLPIADSYRAVFQEIFLEPESRFRLSVNKVAMGKYSHIERFGNLLFVSARSVLPIVNKRLQENNIKVPSDQAVFSLLADNHLTIRTPSGDSLWWIEFISSNNSSRSKEMSYLVFDLSDWETVIDDIALIGVDIQISAKTFGDGITIQDSAFSTLSSLPDLQAKFFPPTTDSDDSETLDENDGVDELPVMAVGAEVNDESPEMDSAVCSVQDEKVEEISSVDSEPEEPAQLPVNDTNANEDSNNRYEVEPARPKLTKLVVKPATTKAASSKEEAPLRKASSGSMFKFGMSVALGDLSNKDIPVSVFDECGDVSNKDIVSRPFDQVNVICETPNSIRLDEDYLAKILEQTVPSTFNRYNGANGLDNSRIMFQVWLPFLSGLVENNVVSCNMPNSSVFVLKEGLFITLDNGLGGLMSDKLCECMMDVLMSTKHSLLGGDSSPIHRLDLNGRVCGGVLLATREFLVKGQRIKGTDLFRIIS